MARLVFYSILLLFSGFARASEGEPFSFHLFVEPNNLDPQLTANASGNYLLFNIYRGLYRYHEQRGLVADGTTGCRRRGLRLLCPLRKEQKWSDGEPITALDYVASFRRLIDPKMASPQSDVIFTVKNAKAIWKGELPPDKLGVFAERPDLLVIELEQPDAEFEYKLIHPALAPLPPGGYRDRLRATEQISSGPYKMVDWKAGAWIRLESNPYYPSNRPRPPVQIFFFDEDSTAQRFFEHGKMSFLRRVTAAEIPRFKGKPGTFQVPMARFDYIGFGPALESKPKLRSALVRGVEFNQFLNLFDTRTPPGCPSLPAKLMDRPYCLKFGEPLNLKELEAAKRLDFHFSRMGGDDIARAAEWFQNQWKTHLNLEVQLRAEEQGVYVRQLRSAPPPIFRKGVNLDRPTCLAAMELFTTDHPDNYIQLRDTRFDRLVADLAASPPAARKRACRKAVEHLLKSNRLIPLGEMHFTIVASPKFTGWSLNSLNQLDLSDLTSARP